MKWTLFFLFTLVGCATGKTPANHVGAACVMGSALDTILGCPLDLEARLRACHGSPVQDDPCGKRRDNSETPKKGDVNKKSH